MTWLTMTHTQRWHAAHHTVGTGHLYQGRYKSFPVQADEYFLQLVRYVERNPVRAQLVEKAEHWKWGGLWIRENNSHVGLLSDWPIPPGKDHLNLVNQVQPKVEVDFIRTSILKNRPLGNPEWTNQTAEILGLKSTLRNKGRPKKGS